MSGSTVGLKLGDAALTEQINSLTNYDSIPADMQKKIDALSTDEKAIVESYIEAKKTGTQESYAAFLQTVREGIQNHDAPGYAKDPSALLASDNDYQTTQQAIDALNVLRSNFHSIDTTSVITDDRLVMGDLENYAKKCHDPAVKKACEYLINHPEITEQFEMNIFRAFEPSDVTKLIDQLNQKQATARKAAASETAASMGTGTTPNTTPTTPVPGATPTPGPASTQNQTTSDSQGATQTPATLPHHAPLTGSDTDQLGQARNNVQGDISKARKDMLDAVNEVPVNQAKLQLAQQTLQDASLAMQALQQMEQMMMTIIQNLSRSYNDIALAALRNIK